MKLKSSVIDSYLAVRSLAIKYQNSGHTCHVSCFELCLAVDVKNMLDFDDIFLGRMQQGQGVTARREYDTVFRFGQSQFRDPGLVEIEQTV